MHINLPLVTLDVCFSDESDSVSLEVKSVNKIHIIIIHRYIYCLAFDLNSSHTFIRGNDNLSSNALLIICKLIIYSF